LRKYVESKLMPGENIVMFSNLHWIIFLPAFLFLLVFIGFIVLFLSSSENTPPGGEIFIVAFLLLVGLFPLLFPLKNRLTTALAITDKRIIIKRGWISRNNVEVDLNKVETVSTDQTFFGRIFNYGTIKVITSSGSRGIFEKIADPAAFQKTVNEMPIA